jgi:hypothetical protein
MSDLHYRVPCSAVGRVHPLCIVERPGRAAFQIDVLSGADNTDEVFRMKVLRRGDDYRVEIAHFEHSPVVGNNARVRDRQRRLLAPVGVDVGDRHALGPWAGKRFTQQLHSAGTGADQPQPDPIVGAEHSGR